MRTHVVAAIAATGTTSQAHRLFCMEGKNMKTHLAIVAASVLALASSQAFAGNTWTCVASNSNPRPGFRAGSGNGTGSSQAKARRAALRDCTELRGPGCRIAWCRHDE